MTRGPRTGTAARALLAPDRNPDRQILARPEGRLGEAQAQAHLGVGSPSRAPSSRTPRPAHRAEEGLEEVPEPTFEVEPPTWPRTLAKDAFGAIGVIAGTTLGVSEDLVGQRDLLELGLRLGVPGVGVGM